jgi:hypothetical protein
MSKLADDGEQLDAYLRGGGEVVRLPSREQARAVAQ